jgi:hypothetical protein
LALLVLTGAKRLENRIKEDNQGKLLIVVDPSGPGEDEGRTVLQAGGFRIASCGLVAGQRTGAGELNYELRWRARFDNTAVLEPMGRIGRARWHTSRFVDAAGAVMQRPPESRDAEAFAARPGPVS